MFKDLLTMAYYLDAFYASVGENPDLCLSVPCKRKKKKEFIVPIVASSVAVVMVLLFIFSDLVIYKRKEKEVLLSLFSVFVIVMTIHRSEVVYK